MKDLQTRIQQMLNEKKNHNRAVALITALSLLMMFIVPYAGIMPGVAMTATGVNGGTYEIDDAGGWFTNPATGYPDGAVNLAPYLTGFTPDPELSNYNAGSDQSVFFQLALEYALSNDQLNTTALKAGTPFLYYQLPDAIRPRNGIFGSGQSSRVTDETAPHMAYGSKTSLAGYFSISEDGLVVIRLTDEYISYLASQQNGCIGSIRFNGKIDRADDENGDQIFSVTTTTGQVNFNVSFDNDTLTSGKSGNVGLDSNGKRYIDWTITINNPSGHINMTNFTISDVLNLMADESTIQENVAWSNIENVAIQIEKQSASDTATVTDNQNGTFTVTGNPKTIRITYRQTDSSDAMGVAYGRYQNNVTVSDSSGTVKTSCYAPVTVQNKLSVNKSGQADYQTAGGKTDDKINWSIRVSNLIGESLQQTVVTDNGIANATGLTVYYYNESGQRTTLDPSNYTVSGSAITFNDDSSLPSVVEIEYSTDVTQSQLGAPVTNEVTVSSNKSTDPPTGDSTSASVTYNHQLHVTKGGNAYDAGSEKFQWKITIENFDATDAEHFERPMESLNGFVISDPAFASLTNDDLADGNILGFNARYRKGYENWNYDDKGNQNSNYYNVTFTKDPNNADNIIIHIGNDETFAPINSMELFIYTAFDDNSFVDSGGSGITLEAAQAAYNAGDIVTAKNTASVTNSTGKETGSGTGEQTANIRCEATKSYDGAHKGAFSVQSPETAVAMNDKADRILDWTIKLIKDNGFSGGNVAVVDTLSTSGSLAKHYMTQAQLDGIQIYGRDGDTRTLIQNPAEGTPYYTVTAAMSESDITGFTVDFNDEIKNLSTKYRYIDVVYQTTAKTGDVKYGETAVFSNGYSFFTSSAEIPGLSFERKYPNPVETSKLNVTKNWDDRSNALDTRPDTIQVKVYQTLTPTDDSSWVEISGSPFTLTVDKATNSKTYTLPPDLPQWVVSGSENAETIHRYYYKIEEVGIADYNSAFEGDDAPAEATQDISYTLRNTLDSSVKGFGKNAVDGYGNTITTQSYSPTKLTVNGVEGDYLITKWRIEFDVGNDMIAEETFTDTIPAGSIYLNNTYTNPDYRPKTVHKYNNTYNSHYVSENPVNTEHWENINGVSTRCLVTDRVSENNGTLTMIFNQDIYVFEYYTAIPIENVTDDYLVNGKLVNSVTCGSKTKSAEVTITDIPEPEVIQPTLIEKTAAEGETSGKFPDAGMLKYGIEFNEEGANLSPGDTVNITDVLSMASGSTKSASQLNFKLVGIDVYPYNQDGTVDRTSPLTAGTGEGQYGRLVSVNRTVTEECRVTGGTLHEYNPIQSWEVLDWEFGDKLSVSLQKSEMDFNGEIWISCRGTSTSKKIEFPEGQLTATGEIVIPEGTTQVVIEYNRYWYDTTINSVTVQSITTIPASMTLTVPDQQHLYIEYVYNVTGYTSNDTLIVNNTASFSDSNGSGSSTVNGWEIDVSESAGNIQTGAKLRLFKVDTGNTAVNTLSSTFKIAKYIGNDQWLFARKAVVTPAGNGTEAFRTLVFPNTSDSDYNSYIETGGDTTYPAILSGTSGDIVVSSTESAATLDDDASVHNFNLGTKTLYKLVEVKAPTEGNYKQPTFKNNGNYADNTEFVYYYDYAGYEGTLPTEAQNKTEQILEGDTLEVKNNQTISLSAVKTFSGSSLPESSTVTFELLWSENRNGTNPHKLRNNTDSIYDLDIGSGVSAEQTVVYTSDSVAQVTWNGLPNGRNGVPIYYFVQETSYTLPQGDTTLTYVYDAASGNFLNQTDSSDVGRFKPVYTMNGTNISGTEIQVNNSEGIIVKKLWKNIKKAEIPPVILPGESTPMAVHFQLFGYTDKGDASTKVELNVSSLVLDSTNNYQVALPENLTETVSGNTHEQSYYQRFEVKELLTEAQQTALQQLNYADKAVFDNKVVNGVGTLELTNVNNTVSTTTASAVKVWSDGNENHGTDSLNATLIQSTTPNLTSSQITSQPANSGFASGNTVKLVEVNHTLTVPLSNVKACTSLAFASITTGDTGLTISGTSAGTGDITVTFNDDSTAVYTVTVLNPSAVLNASGNWQASWDGLPAENTAGDTLYYYVRENSVPTGYTVEYAVSGQKTTITNTKEVTSLFVQKVWRTDDTGYTSLSPEFTLYRRSGSNGAWGEVTANAPTVSKNDKIWTYTFVGLDKYDESGNEYQFKVEETAIGGYETAYSNNDGTTGGNSSTPIVVTNTELTSLAVRKEWSDGADKHGSDEITVVLHRSTDLAVVPVVTTIGSSTSSTTSSTTTSTAEETTTTTTTVFVFSNVIKAVNVPAGSQKITFEVIGEPNASVGGAVCYQSAIEGAWKNNLEWSASIESDGNVLVTVTLPEEIQQSNSDFYVELQCWWSNVWISEGNTVDYPMSFGTCSFTPLETETTTTSTSTTTTTETSSEETTTTTTNTENGNWVNVELNEGQVDLSSYSNVSKIKIVLSGSSSGTNGYLNIQPSGSRGTDGASYESNSIIFDVSDLEEITSCSYSIYNAWNGEMSVSLTGISVFIPTVIRSAPRPPDPVSTQPATILSTLASSPLTAQHVYRAGKLTRAEEIIEENEEIETISQAVSTLMKPKVVLLATSLSGWVSEGTGEAMTLTISSTDSWQWTDSLTMYDASGNKYYYWVEETAITGNSTLTAFDVAYKFDDGSDDTTYCIDAELHGNGEITIRNTPKESQAGVLPESGSTGTRIYYTIGAMLLLLAAAGYATYSIKRRRWYDE